MRCYDKDLQEKMTKRITEVAEETAKAYECEAVVKIWDKYPPVINHAE